MQDIFGKSYFLDWCVGRRKWVRKIKDGFGKTVLLTEIQDTMCHQVPRHRWHLQHAAFLGPMIRDPFGFMLHQCRNKFPVNCKKQ